MRRTARTTVVRKTNPKRWGPTKGPYKKEAASEEKITLDGCRDLTQMLKTQLYGPDARDGFCNHATSTPIAKEAIPLRCARPITVFDRFCPEHSELRTGLRVAKSRIPGVGDGLFAITPFEMGDTIDVYDGMFVAEMKDVDPNYQFEVCPGVYIDASNTQSCLARWANSGAISNLDDAKSAASLSTTTTNNNSQYRHFGVPGSPHKAIILVALRDIVPGEELCVDYGVHHQPIAPASIPDVTPLSTNAREVV